jgi:hypothetical protein
MQNLKDALSLLIDYNWIGFTFNMPGLGLTYKVVSLDIDDENGRFYGCEVTTTRRGHVLRQTVSESTLRCHLVQQLIEELQHDVT